MSQEELDNQAQDKAAEQYAQLAAQKQTPQTPAQGLPQPENPTLAWIHNEFQKAMTPPQDKGLGWGYRLNAEGRWVPMMAGEYAAKVYATSSNNPPAQRKVAQMEAEAEQGRGLIAGILQSYAKTLEMGPQGAGLAKTAMIQEGQNQRQERGLAARKEADTAKAQTLLNNTKLKMAAAYKLAKVKLDDKELDRRARYLLGLAHINANTTGESMDDSWAKQVAMFEDQLAKKGGPLSTTVVQ